LKRVQVGVGRGICSIGSSQRVHNATLIRELSPFGGKKGRKSSDLSDGTWRHYDWPQQRASYRCGWGNVTVSQKSHFASTGPFIAPVAAPISR
jgi:hypothetical protein